MTSRTDATRRGILDAAYRCFYREGYFRTSVDAVAAAAKVTKKTLYYHFDSKDNLIGAVLADQQSRALELIEAAIAVDERDAAAAIRGVFDAYRRWSSGPHWFGSGFTRIAMELAEMPGHPARLAARRHKLAVEAAVAALLSSRGVSGAEALARRIVLLLEGANTLALIHQDPGYVAEAGDVAAALVAASASDRRRKAKGRGASRP